MTTHRFERVLIVEDDETLARILERNLVGRNIGVRRAASVGEALSAISATRPDLLVLDINLPDRSGWELLRSLRARRIEIPTIIISAARCAPERLAEFGTLAYLPKPFPLEALLRLITSPAPAATEVG
jgi:DNA-binding response OmpR family regulator